MCRWECQQLLKHAASGYVVKAANAVDLRDNSHRAVSPGTEWVVVRAFLGFVLAPPVEDGGSARTSFRLDVAAASLGSRDLKDATLGVIRVQRAKEREGVAAQPRTAILIAFVILAAAIPSAPTKIRPAPTLAFLYLILNGGSAWACAAS